MKSINCKINFIALFLSIICLPLYSADNSNNIYTYQTLKDTMINIPVVDIMVPNGFTAQVTSQWDRLDGSFQLDL